MQTLLVLFGKISDEISRYVASEPLRNLFYLVVKMIFVLCATSATAFPKETWATVYAGLSYSNFYAPKFAFFWVIAYIVSPKLFKRFYGARNPLLVEGVPVSELVDHIILEGSFKRDEVEGKFAIPRNRYQSLANRLDEFGVFVRGANNERKVREGISRETVANALGSTPSGHPRAESNSPPLSLFGFTFKKLQTPWTDAEKPGGNPVETQ